MPEVEAPPPVEEVWVDVEEVSAFAEVELLVLQADKPNAAQRAKAPKEDFKFIKSPG